MMATNKESPYFIGWSTACIRSKGWFPAEHPTPVLQVCLFSVGSLRIW